MVTQPRASMLRRCFPLSSAPPGGGRQLACSVTVSRDSLGSWLILTGKHTLQNKTLIVAAHYFPVSAGENRWEHDVMTRVGHVPLVPHHQVEQVFADRLFAGVLWGTELCPPMGQRAGQEETLVTGQSENRDMI